MKHHLFALQGVAVVFGIIAAVVVPFLLLTWWLGVGWGLLTYAILAVAIPSYVSAFRYSKRH